MDMTCRHLVLAALLSSSLAVPAAAQSSVDVSKLPVNLERIQRQLQQSTVREDRNGLNLRYVVEVYGQAPRIELFTQQENLQSGPVPYGAPTHQQMIEAITPREYRAPAADMGALFRWFADKARDKSR
jgi:hypothetical protein